MTQADRMLMLRTRWPYCLTAANIGEQIIDAAVTRGGDRSTLTALNDERERRRNLNCFQYDELAEALGVHVDSKGWGERAFIAIGVRRPFGPNKQASKNCESGHRDYCTCDTCF